MLAVSPKFAVIDCLIYRCAQWANERLLVPLWEQGYGALVGDDSVQKVNEAETGLLLVRKLCATYVYCTVHAR